MKLGTETGSLVNHLYARNGCAIVPNVGDGATICLWTDRHACTIVSVNGKRIGVKRDRASRIDSNGLSDAQDYSYHRDHNAPVQWFSWREKRREWIEVGTSNGNRLSLGKRKEYHDFSF